MLSVLKELRQAIQNQRPVAYCRLIETRGSTPQKAGATMLVFQDGQQAGTLGGGCVEAEVKRKALRVLGKAETQVSTFQLDHDYGWDDGLICGGRMTVLIEPIVENHRYFELLLDQAESSKGFTEAIVFDAGKSGLPMPASFLMNEEDEPIASLHAEIGVAESVLPSLRPLSSRPRAYVESAQPTYHSFHAAS